MCCCAQKVWRFARTTGKISAEMPEEFVTEGDGIEIDGLTPLEDLPIEQQTRIKNELDALPEEYLDVLRNYGGKEKFNLS